MVRRWSKVAIYDFAHKGAVTALLGLTAFGSGLLLLRTYRYFTVIRPLRKQQQLVSKEEEMSQEQSERELELMNQQRDAEKLKM